MMELGNKWESQLLVVKPKNMTAFGGLALRQSGARHFFIWNLLHF